MGNIIYIKGGIDFGRDYMKCCEDYNIRDFYNSEYIKEGRWNECMFRICMSKSMIRK